MSLENFAIYSGVPNKQVGPNKPAKSYLHLFYLMHKALVPNKYEVTDFPQNE